MSGTWASGWVTGDVVTAAEFRKGLGCVVDSTLGVSAASFDFTGLPTSYAALRILLDLRSDTVTTTDAVTLRFNNDSGANYDYENLDGSVATASAVNVTATTSIRIGACAGASASASIAGMLEIVVPNYAGTTFFKSCSAHGFSGVSAERVAGGIWKSTSAINRVTILCGGNFIAGSRASVYAMGS